MYLIAHQDDCQMVTGERREVGEALKRMGPDHAAAYPVTLIGRICTCEPRAIKLWPLGWENPDGYCIPSIV